MLLAIKNMIGASVMSLQTGQPLARLDSPIVDPRSLKITAFYVSGPMVDFSPAVVFSEDIREFGPLGAIVDSSDVIVSPDGMVRLNEITDLNFKLDGINVVDEHRRKLGKVENYTLDPESFVIQQLYVKPTMMKSLSITNLTISRNQITAIDNDKITVKAPTVRDKVVRKVAETTAPISGDFENPFRKPKPAVEQVDQE